MHLNIGQEIVRHFEQALLLACFTLLAIFIPKLYNARVRFINLRRQGLVRTCLSHLAMVNA